MAKRSKPAVDDPHDLLPWYVNGTLAEGQAALVEQLVSQPGASSDLALLRELSLAMQMEHRGFDEEAALARLLARVHAGGATRKTPRAVAAVWQWHKLIAWLEPKLAFAALLVVAQGIVIATLLQRAHEPEYAQVRSNVPAAQPAQTVYRVTFAPNASEHEIRLLLIKARAHIVQGPTQLGDYYLVLARSGNTDALALLEQADLIDSIEKVDRIPDEIGED